jgi:hypothetical protein
MLARLPLAPAAADARKADDQTARRSGAPSPITRHEANHVE